MQYINKVELERRFEYLLTNSKKISYRGYVRYYVYDEAENITYDENVRVRDLFGSIEEWTRSMTLLVRLIDVMVNKGVEPDFGCLESLVRYLTDDGFRSASDMTAEDILRARAVGEESVVLSLVRMESYLKLLAKAGLENGPGLITGMEGSKKALYYIINEIGNRDSSRMFVREAHPLLEALRRHRNEEAHGLEPVTVDVEGHHEEIAIQIVVCLMHVANYLYDNVSAYLDRIENEFAAASVADNEHDRAVTETYGDLKRRYVSGVRASCASYIAKNAGVTSPDELMPVTFRPFGGEGVAAALLSVEDMLESDAHVSLVLGVPGAGKTTMLNNMMLRAADRWLEESEDDSADSAVRMPVMIYLSGVKADGTFIDALRGAFRHAGFDAAMADRELAEGGLIIGVDGLNELKIKDAEIFLRGMFDVVNANRGCRFVMTGRLYEFSAIRRLVDEHCDASMYEVQDITPDMVRGYMRHLDVPDSARATFAELMEKDHIAGLLTCPLNFSILIDIAVSGGSDFTADNRGELLRVFMDRVLGREDLLRESRARMMLHQLAICLSADMASVHVDRFASSLLETDSRIYGSEDKVKGIVEALVRVGLVVSDADGGLSFKIDTYQEYFLAEAMAAHFRAMIENRLWEGRSVPPEPDIEDDKNFETYRLMIEVMAKESLRRGLVEMLYSRMLGSRAVLPASAAPVLRNIPRGLVTVSRLVSTLPYEFEYDGAGRALPGAKALVEGWVLNYMRLLADRRQGGARPGSGPSAKYMEMAATVIEAGATLSTRDFYFRLFDDFWIKPYMDDDRMDELAAMLLACCSDTRTMYASVWDAWTYGKSIPAVAALAGKCLDDFFHSRRALQLGILYKYLAARIEDNPHPINSELESYFKAALLTADAVVIGSVDIDKVLRARVSVNELYFNRLLARHAIPEVRDAIFGENMLRYYSANPDTLRYVLRYLVFNGAVSMVAAILKNKALGIVDMLGGVEGCRWLFNLIPVNMISEDVIEELYEPEMLGLARVDNPWALLERSPAQTEELERHMPAMYISPVIYKNDRTYSVGFKTAGFDSEGNAIIVTDAVENPARYVGCTAVLSGDDRVVRAKVLDTDCLREDFFEIDFSSLKRVEFPPYGYLTWSNAESRRHGSLRYSLALSDGHVVRLRLTDNAPVRALCSDKWRALITSPDTMYKIGEEHVTPLGCRYISGRNPSTSIKVAVTDPDAMLGRLDKIGFESAEGVRMPIEPVEFLSAASPWKVAGMRLVMYDARLSEGVVSFLASVAAGVGAGAWVRMLGHRYHARTMAPSEHISASVSVRGVDLACDIPLSGLVSVDGLGAPLRYFAVCRGNRRYDVTLVCDESSACLLAERITVYRRLDFEGLSSPVIIQCFDEKAVNAPLTLVRMDFGYASEEDMAPWYEGGEVDFYRIKTISNVSPADNNRYKVSTVPYFTITDDGYAVLPVPTDTRVLPQLVYYPDDTGLRCKAEKIQSLYSYDGGEYIKVLFKRIDNGLTPRMNRAGGVVHMRLRDGVKAYLGFSNILHLIDFDLPARYHSGVGRAVLDAMVKYGTIPDMSHVRFFNKLGVTHLMYENAEFVRQVEKIVPPNAPQLFSIGIVTRQYEDATEVLRLSGGTFITPDTAHHTLSQGCAVIVSANGRLLRLGDDVPQLPAYNVYEGMVSRVYRKDGRLRMTVSADVSVCGRDEYVHTPEDGNPLPVGMPVSFMLFGTDVRRVQPKGLPAYMSGKVVNNRKSKSSVIVSYVDSQACERRIEVVYYGPVPPYRSDINFYYNPFTERYVRVEI